MGFWVDEFLSLYSLDLLWDAFLWFFIGVQAQWGVLIVSETLFDSVCYGKIKPRQQKKILFEDISGYEEGKKIAFYYWIGKGPEGRSIKGFSIDTEL